SSDASCAAAQRLSCAPPPSMPVSSAMMAKVGAAARYSRSAGPEAANSPLSHVLLMQVSLMWSSLVTLACEIHSPLVILVLAPPPDAARLVASLGGAIEPLVHAPKAVQSARVGGIGVVD